MTNLNIQQNTSGLEIVSSSLIDKLYKLALSSKVTDENNQLTMNLSGNLQSNAAYEDAVEYLLSKFPDLHITITNNNYYIRFTDSKVEEICKTNWSKDGIGVTKQDLSTVTELGGVFSDLDIKSLVDLKHFKPENYIIRINAYGLYNIDYLYNQIISRYGDEFNRATNGNPLLIYQDGLDIEMPTSSAINMYSNNSVLFGAWYQNNNDRTEKMMLNINSIKWNGSYISSVYNSATCLYSRCKIKWSDSILPDQTEFTNYILFKRCVIDKVIFREGITRTDQYFYTCDVPYIVYPSTIQYVGHVFDSFRRDAPSTTNNTGCVVFKAVVPPETPSSSTWNDNYPKYPQYIYVPDGSVQAYKTAGGPYWGSDKVISRITPMSSMPQQLREILEITDEDIYRT